MHHLRNLNSLQQIQVLPMEFEWQSGDTDAAGNPVEIRHERPDHQYVSEAVLEAAVIREECRLNKDQPVGHVTRDLTDAEIDWVNENHPEWVAEICDEEWQQDNTPEY